MQNGKEIGFRLPTTTKRNLEQSGGNRGNFIQTTTITNIHAAKSYTDVKANKAKILEAFGKEKKTWQNIFTSHILHLRRAVSRVKVSLINSKE